VIARIINRSRYQRLGKFLNFFFQSLNLRVEKMLDKTKETLKREAKETFYHKTKRRSNMFETALESRLDLSLSHLVYQSRVEHLKSILKRYNERLNKLLATQLKINNLNNDKEALFSSLSGASLNYNLIENIMDKSLPFFRVVSFARINKEYLKLYKYFPNRKRILALTLITSLLGFSFFAVAKELCANTLFRGWQLSAHKRHVEYAEVPDLRVLVNNKSYFESVFSKHIQEICLATKESMIIRISSGLKGEGKATIARVLALYHQKLGKSVVLVDSDVAHRSLSRFFGLDDRPGLMEYIFGQKKMEDIIVRNQLPGISLIAAGSRKFSEQDASILASMADLASILTSDYEKLIFIDSPFNDMHTLLAGIMPSHDIIMVLKSGEHSIYEAERMIRIHRLTEGQATLKGTVINRIPFEANVFSLKGLVQLALYIIGRPYSLLKK